MQMMIRAACCNKCALQLAFAAAAVIEMQGMVNVHVNRRPIALSRASQR